MVKKNVIFYNILFLCLLYFSIALLFALMYVLAFHLKLGTVIDHYSSYAHQQQGIDILTRSFYFSIITLFSVGYGDMTPFGLSKGIAIIESLIGYVLPYAIVLNYILFRPRNSKGTFRNR